jgi:hypothetical protein
MNGDRHPDALSRAILDQRPELAGQVHYVDGRPWCDGINHTLMCHPPAQHIMSGGEVAGWLYRPDRTETRTARVTLATSRAARDTDAGQQLGESAYRAAELARDISTHHQQCATCRRGGQLAVGPRGIRRYPCPDEAALFRQLADAQAKGWPG